MATTFHYDSREHHQPMTRTKRFYAFLVVVACIIVALSLLMSYGNDWSSDQSAPSFLRGVIIGLLISLSIFIVFWLASKKSKWGYSDHQTLVVDDYQVSWLLNKQDGEQSVAFTDVKHAVLDQRHLMLKLENGEERWIENYTLIDRESQWDAFVSAIGQKITIK